jgi:hypothetical protein
MPEGSGSIAAFQGAVRCRRDPAGPLRITLEGLAEGEPLAIAFSGATDPGLPEALAAAVVERLEPGRYRIAAGDRDWRIEAAAVHLHRDVSKAFYEALPPRPAPARRRLMLRGALWLAGSRAGLALLRALRG